MYKVIEIEYREDMYSSDAMMDVSVVQRRLTLWNAIKYVAEHYKDQSAIINLRPEIAKDWKVEIETKWDLLGHIQYQSRYYPLRDKKGNKVYTRYEILPESLVIDWPEFWEDV